MNYDEKVKRSISSYNELLYRIRLTEDAIGLYYYYGQGWNQRQREDQQGVGFRPEDRVRYIAVQFAFLQIAAILDQQGEYSLRMQKNTFTVSAKRLKNLFPTLKNPRLDRIHSDVNSVLGKHSKTINTVFKVRNSRIAHVGDITYKSVSDENDEYSYYKIQTHIPSSFRFKRITELCRDLDCALLTPFNLSGFDHNGDYGSAVSI